MNITFWSVTWVHEGRGPYLIDTDDEDAALRYAYGLAEAGRSRVHVSQSEALLDAVDTDRVERLRKRIEERTRTAGVPPAMAEAG